MAGLWQAPDGTPLAGSLFLASPGLGSGFIRSLCLLIVNVRGAVIHPVFLGAPLPARGRVVWIPPALLQARQAPVDAGQDKRAVITHGQ